MTLADAPAPPFDTPLVLRDALIRALCLPTHPDAEPRGHLAMVDAVAARVVLRRETFPLHLFAWDAASPRPYDDLAAWLDRVARGARVGVTHVVLCGGPRDAQRVLERRNTFRLLERRVIVHHVFLSGEIWDAGDGLKLLKQVVGELRAVAATGIRARTLDPGELFVLQQEFHRLVEAERQFERRLMAQRPWATLGLIALVMGVFALENRWGGPDAAPTLYRMGAIVPDRIFAGEAWRLLSGTLLHGGLGHLIVNAWGIWAIGSFLERLFGRARFVVAYGLAGIAGSTASALSIGERVSVGASGAIFGLLGAVLALVWRANPLVPPIVATNIKRSLWPVLGVNVVFSLLPQVDASAHLGGFLAGLALVATGWLTRGLVREQPGSPAPRPLRVLAILMGAMLVSSGLVAIAVDRPWELAAPPRLERVALGDTGFTIELPAGLARLPPEVDEARATFLFGALRRDLAEAAVTVFAEPEDDAREKLEEIRADPGNSTDLRVGEEPRIDEIDGHPTVVVEGARSDGVSVQRWFTVRGGTFVTIEFELSPSADTRWLSVGDEVFHSLRAPVR